MNLPLPEANSEISAAVREWLDHFAVCGAGSRLRGGATVLAPGHRHLRHLSGTGEEPIGLDGTAPYRGPA